MPSKMVHHQAPNGVKLIVFVSNPYIQKNVEPVPVTRSTIQRLLALPKQSERATLKPHADVSYIVPSSVMPLVHDIKTALYTTSHRAFPLLCFLTVC